MSLYLVLNHVKGCFQCVGVSLNRTGLETRGRFGWRCIPNWGELYHLCVGHLNTLSSGPSRRFCLVGSAVPMYFLWSIYLRNLHSRPHSWSWRVREAPQLCCIGLLVGFWSFGAPEVSLQVFIFFILVFECSYKLTAVFLDKGQFVFVGLASNRKGIPVRVTLTK